MNRKIIGFVQSSFDLLHAGHILYLKDAKSQCDYLIAAIQSDPTIDRPEKNKPIETLQERIIKIGACKYVDQIAVYNTEKDLYNLIQKHNPDVIIMGSDWEEKDNPIKKLAKIYYHDRSGHEYSTSNLRDRIVTAQKDHSRL